MTPRLYLAVLAGGQSTRARAGDSTPPKQFRRAGGTMLLLHSLRELLRAPGVVHATVVVPDAWRAVVTQALDELSLAVPIALAPAGAQRTQSAWHALQAIAALEGELAPRADDLVAIHDAARPFASHHLLTRVAVAAALRGAAIPGVAVTDTVVQLAESRNVEVRRTEQAVAEYLERASLVAVQTPQVFRFADLHAAHAWCAEQNEVFTDDGGLLAARGLRPVVVMGEAQNWKVTTEDDWTRVEARFGR